MVCGGVMGGGGGGGQRPGRRQWRTSSSVGFVAADAKQDVKIILWPKCVLRLSQKIVTIAVVQSLSLPK